MDLKNLPFLKECDLIALSIDYISWPGPLGAEKHGSTGAMTGTSRYNETIVLENGITLSRFEGTVLLGVVLTKCQFLYIQFWYIQQVDGYISRSFKGVYETASPNQHPFKKKGANKKKSDRRILLPLISI